ncbi:hypothetical protein RFM41_17780 [Mesorhizobium sp. VK25A]|uniref:DUF680 domain-containing protein n=1 Tax=Mesorhizobium vachelliae TaxID=3072309 RepID=A0ABU4ZZG2_9HYPH|nr:MULTISPECIES: hypothetical protein [unclassified Mesorhizobium]MDX8529393.1 hypothetical protein [Mesorhizobium sp. VK25D]MDX8545603.1 hypothetical protein [Mesorhizobium sp. VK25A]
MLTRLIAASALVLAMGGVAMAQSSDDWWWHRDHRPAASEQVDPYATGSINGGSGLTTYGNTGAIGPCADTSPGPDANSQQNVNDHYCGK